MKCSLEHYSKLPKQHVPATPVEVPLTKES